MGGALLVDYLETQVDLAWVQAEFGCTGDCRPVFEAFVEHPSWSCSGAPNISRAGSWIGHVFPGQCRGGRVTMWGTMHTRTCSRVSRVPLSHMSFPLGP